jgi:MFS family permease
MCFNIGVIIGPILGGSLADPVHSFPQLFGPDSVFGGKEGVWWMQRWPYALPNVLSAIFIFASVLAVFLGLDEVSISPSMKLPGLVLTIIRHTKSHDTEKTGAADWESESSEL